jgi:short-subunit dehydrogenase
MRELSGKTAILTGASGGLGRYIALALAQHGVNLVLAAYPGEGLDSLKEVVSQFGIRAFPLVANFRHTSQLRSVVEEAKREFGRIDLLINNAGVEFTSAYHELPEENIGDIIGINLEAPMLLARLVLADMLERRCGHIVNMSSLAGKIGPAFQEPYAATKAALIAFTASLRATYRGTGVSASVICPGFVEAGIYAKLKKETGFPAPALLGTSPPEPVAQAVVKAIRRDLPEVIINPYPVKPLIATAILFPRLGEFLVRRTGAHEFFGRAAEALRRKRLEAQK